MCTLYNSLGTRVLSGKGCNSMQNTLSCLEIVQILVPLLSLYDCLSSRILWLCYSELFNCVQTQQDFLVLFFFVAKLFFLFYVKFTISIFFLNSISIITGIKRHLIIYSTPSVWLHFYPLLHYICFNNIKTAAIELCHLIVLLFA